MGPPTASTTKPAPSNQPIFSGYNSGQQPQQQQQQRNNQTSQVFYQDPEHAELEYNRGLRTTPQQQQLNNNNNDNNFNRVISQYNHLPQSTMMPTNMMYGNSGNTGGYPMSSNQSNNRRMM